MILIKMNYINPSKIPKIKKKKKNPMNLFFFEILDVKKKKKNWILFAK